MFKPKFKNVPNPTKEEMDRLEKELAIIADVKPTPPIPAQEIPPRVEDPKPDYIDEAIEPIKEPEPKPEPKPEPIKEPEPEPEPSVTIAEVFTSIEDSLDAIIEENMRLKRITKQLKRVLL